MSKRHFGTDGVRGVANQDLTPEFALRLGRAAGAFVPGRGAVLLGWDPRLSSAMLKSAFAAGCCSSGLDVVEAGVIPTGVLAAFVPADGFPLGAMVSASHNPAEDNGIKLIGPNGRKLADEHEIAVEGLLVGEPERAGPRDVGRVREAVGLHERHLAQMRELFPANLGGMRLAVDCAHGAASGWAGPALTQAGANVTEVGVEPDGLNINAEGGATKPALIQKLAAEERFDAGLAFDGDADRVVFADERGRLVNGDQVMALWASRRRRAGKLDPPVVVGTVMSNMGVERFLQGEGIQFVRAPVGDRYVVEKMDETGARIGGEQSGHVVFSGAGPTGDGILTALEILTLLAEEELPMSAASELFEPWPQVLLNVRVADRATWRTEGVSRVIEEAERELGADGRLLVRASGTQPMVRVMCEHRIEAERNRAAERVVEALLSEAGGEIYSKVELTHALGD